MGNETEARMQLQAFFLAYASKAPAVAYRMLKAIDDIWIEGYRLGSSDTRADMLADAKPDPMKLREGA